MTARSLAFGPALALAGVLAFSGSAMALDDGQESLVDTLTGIVNLGSGKPAPEIDYRERAPLVLPPKGAQLRQPAVRGERSAAWPVDPDVQRRKEAAEKARAPIFLSDKVMLSKRELMAGRVANNPQESVNQPSPGCRAQDGSCLWVHPDVLRSQGVRPDRDEKLVVGQEPGRAWLTQPPKGYRRATQASGVGKQTVAREDDGSNPLGYFIQKFRGRDDEE